MPDLRYVLPFDRLDMNNLDLYIQRPRKQVLWTREDLNGESTYQQVEILCKDYQDEEPPDAYICHICNVHVPEIYLKEHNESQKHKNYKILTEIALENQSKVTYTSIPDVDPDNKSKTFYCETCSEIVLKNDEGEHILTQEHMKSKQNDKLADDFLTMYIEIRNILTERNKVKTTAKANLENNDSETDSAGVAAQQAEELIECDSEDEMFIKNTGQFCTIRNLASECFKPQEEKNEMKAKTDGQNWWQKPSIEKIETRNFEQYLQEVVVKKFKLNYNLLVLDDSIVLLTAKGYRKKITVDIFHSYRRIDDTVFCQLCQVWICQTKVHCLTDSHVKYVTQPVDDNFARKINATWSHCLVCNERILTGSNHAALNSYHINQVDSSERNEVSIEYEDVSKQTFCYICSTHVATNNIASHIKNKVHADKCKIQDKRSGNEICIHYSKLEYRSKDSKFERSNGHLAHKTSAHDSVNEHRNGDSKYETNIHNSNKQNDKDNTSLGQSKDPDVEIRIKDSILDPVNVDSKYKCLAYDSELERNKCNSKSETNIASSKNKNNVDNLSLEHSKGSEEIEIRTSDSILGPNKNESKDEICGYDSTVERYNEDIKNETSLHNTELEQNNNDANFEHNVYSKHETRNLDSKLGSSNACSKYATSIKNSENEKETCENNSNYNRDDLKNETLDSQLLHGNTDSEFEENDESSDFCSKNSDSDYENTNSSDYSYIVSKPMTNSAKFYSYCKQFTYIDETKVNCDVCKVKIDNKKKSIICHVENGVHKDAVNQLLNENNIIITSHIPLYYCAFCDALLECFLDHLEDENHLSWIHLSDKISKRKLKYKANECPKIAEFRQKYKALLVFNYVIPRGRSSYCEACGVKLARYSETEHIFTKSHKSKLKAYLKQLRA